MSDVITEEERHEAATEEPTTVGCLSLGLGKLPGGFDGVEPEKDLEELKRRGAKLKACNDRSYAKMNEIARIANECVQQTTHAAYMAGQYGEDYRAFGRAFCEIRKLVWDSIADVEPDYEMLAWQFARNSFDFSKFQEAVAAVASMKQDDFPGVYYSPGWLVELAKRLSADGKVELPKLVKRCAKTPQTIVFEFVRPSGLKLSAEWEAEATDHSAQAFLYRDDKCVCQIRFFNDFQTRNVGRIITRNALYGLASLCGHAKRWRENKKAEKGGVQ